MRMLKIRNWDRWQSYRKDREQPPWIKVHRCVMRNHEWVSLSDAERGQLVSIWLLAADKNGEIPDDPAFIQRLCYLAAPPDIKKFMDLGFICHDDASVTPERRHDDVPEKRREEEEIEAEGERRAAVAATPSPPETKPNGKGTRLPADWDVGPELYRWATDEFPRLDVSAELDKFIDYWQARAGPGGVKRDWDAAFRNWMRKANEYAGGRYSQRH